MMTTSLIQQQDYTIHARTMKLADGDDTALDILNLEAAVASGDYFVTIATQLDNIDDVMNHPELEPIVRQLIYLQANYTIVKK